ncbi:MAG: Uncharacterised protein [Flavobacteriaceae bacterium]|nr:MAG: Uncharacterised protein [Flavobacteriaceae bacterium]
MTAMVKSAVSPIWSIHGNSGKTVSKALPLAHPLAPTFRNIAIGIELKAPHIAALLVVFFQNKPKIKTAKIPGLTIPVYSWMN